MLLLLLLFFSSYLSPSPHAHFDTLLMLPIALTVFCWRPVLFTFYTFAFALEELHTKVYPKVPG